MAHKPIDPNNPKGLKGNSAKLSLVPPSPKKSHKTIEVPKPPTGRQTAKHPITGLTEKQEMFCRKVTEGMTLSDAYRFSYDASGMKDSTIWTKGSALMAMDKVADRVVTLQVDREAKSLHDAAQTRSFVLRRLREEASGGDTSAARIRALELLGKLDTVGMFRERIEQETKQRTPEQVEAELERRLAEYLKAGTA